MLRVSPRTLALGVCAAAVFAPLHAQQVVLTPHIGYYSPTENLYESKPGLASGSESYKLDPGTAVGGSLGVWFSSRVGVNLSGAHVATNLRRQRSSGDQLTEAAITQASAQAVFLLGSPGATVLPFLNGGFGLVSRGGGAFEASAETSNIAGIFGAGASLRFGMVALTVGAEVADYSATYDLAGGPPRRFAQRDVQLRIGLGTVFGGK